jgi:hypothetical protein
VYPFFVSDSYCNIPSLIQGVVNLHLISNFLVGFYHFAPLYFFLSLNLICLSTHSWDFFLLNTHDLIL